MNTDPDTAKTEDDQEYRSRWLDCFLATYATIGVLAGFAVTVATSIKKEENATLAGAVCILSGIQVVLILWMFHRLRRVYDLLGFTPSLREPNAKEEYFARTRRYADQARRF